MIRGISKARNPFPHTLKNHVKRALSTSNTSSEVEASDSLPEATTKIHKQIYSGPKRSLGKLKSPSNEDVFSLLQDIQYDLAATSNPGEEGGPDMASSKPSSSPSIEDMPLSPLMHPKLVAARRRHLEAKPLPSKDITDFETLLAKNPFANMLTSPVRRCILTGNRLPTSLLLSLSIRNHPRTNDPWLVPLGFAVTKDELAREAAELARQSPPPPAQPSMDDEEPSSEINETEATVPPGASKYYVPKASAALPSLPSPKPPTLYITASYSSLVYLTSLRKRPLQLMLPVAFRAAMGAKVSALVVREDMPDFVLGLYRAKITRLLRYLADSTAKGKGYLRGSNDVESVGSVLQIGAIVVMSGQELSARVWEEMKAVRAMEGREGGEVPIFDLVEILGKEGVTDLRQQLTVDEQRKGSVLRFDVVVIKRKKLTREVVEWLWRLKGYMEGMHNGNANGNE